MLDIFERVKQVRHVEALQRWSNTERSKLKQDLVFLSWLKNEVFYVLYLSEACRISQHNFSHDSLLFFISYGVSSSSYNAITVQLMIIRPSLQVYIKIGLIYIPVPTRLTPYPPSSSITLSTALVIANA